MTTTDLLARLCLQLVVILAVCRIIGTIGRRLGQAQAVCDMVAGVLLGPSLFGWIAPGAQAWLFPTMGTVAVAGRLDVVPHPSMAILYVLAQIGIALYMFLVGLDFDLAVVRHQGRAAAAVSLAGIAVPFALGGAAATFLVHQPGLFGAGLSPVDAALFFALSLSITAFPVLARILEEHGIGRTTLGTLVIGAAATNDAVAWCLLAILLGMVGASAQGPVLTLGATILYVVLMLSLGRMGLRAFARWSARQEDGGGPMLGVALLVVLLGSWWTTVIGIHLIFGAFIAGVAMPRGRVALALRRQLESVTTALFLPLFFVYSGLNTRLALLNTPALWLLTALVVVLAVAGKGLGCALAARGMGMPWREASAVGTLMNARGLIELVLLNVGLERHFITPALFTILVVMALVTTLLTTPIFRALYPRERLAALAEPLEAVSLASPGDLRHV